MDILSRRSLIEQLKKHAQASDREGAFPEQEFELVRKAGLLEMSLLANPYRYKEFNTSQLIDVLIMLGSASLPVGRIYEGHANALLLISLFGDQQQKDTYFSEVFNKQCLFGVWNTQDGDGVKIHDIGNGKYKLSGAKTFCSGAGWIQRPLITGELISTKTEGWQMCIIPEAKVKEIVSDASFWQPLGMRASASFRMDFSGIVLDQSDLLGPPGAYYQQPYFSGGAIRFAAVQLGGAIAMMEETHRFLKELNRTDDPFQRARMGEIAYLVETGNLWLGRATQKTESSADQTGQLLAYINMTRTVINEVCLKSMHLAECSVGARGLMRPYSLERIHRDLTTYLKQPAPDATLTSIGKYVFDQKDTSSLWTD
ncbi:acyl-CoA dehydrogenase family protein [Dyadobacter arcticus]|uniref:Alkylation response protein AidB-like acyl-CoA dehydrogenase n=1 Tax=Dyadobacter arcticus TaxID=1078754 RepID=A0ABX0UU93_9BACT|nr:acyl-CoA dehydrogenase family protein [Dyadobacter arcticus]NIJ54501.1 alkylation response protein AidB-like acyl-CoA dehydrogenase [Dyadobacter arcticus]